MEINGRIASKNKVGISETKIIFIIFFLRGIKFTAILTSSKRVKDITIHTKEVAIAAPIKPYFTTKMTFNIRFIIEAIIKFIKIVFDFPAIMSIVVQRPENTDIKLPKASIQNALSDARYSFPKKIFINTPGKIIISKNIGIIIINIHFETCLDNSLTTLKFLSEYSFVING